MSRFADLTRAPNDPLEDALIVGVSRGGLTDPFKELMIFGVSQGAPTELNGDKSVRCQTRGPN